MTRESFLDMLRVLSGGATVEIRSCSDGSWIQARVSPTGGHFEIHVDGQWRPCAIGAPGCGGWRSAVVGAA